MDEKKVLFFDLIITNLKGMEAHRREHVKYDWAGPANVRFRQDFMEHLTGKKLPKAKCGIHVLMGAVNDKIKQDEQS